MPNSFDQSLPSDMYLLLRADAEQCWLHSEVIPVLQHLEEREQLPEEEVGAALAYLEAMWDEATTRARETDAALAHLHSRESEPEALYGPASSYHAAVCALRGIIATRVTPLVEQPLTTGAEGATSTTSTLRLADTRRPPTGGRTPRAA